MKPIFYLVGGAVRDKFLDKKSKDMDYAVEADSYAAMRQAILDRGGEIFLEQEQFLTIRAKVPNLGAADFVLCRKESHYTDGRHPEKVSIGTIQDDLARRDFTMNAIALSEEGAIIDPFGGINDIKNGVINTVGKPQERFDEDRLRILRALRFAVTLKFRIHLSLHRAIEHIILNGDPFKGVSQERIREELYKMFRADTVQAINYIEVFHLKTILFKDSLWLKPTFEEKS